MGSVRGRSWTVIFSSLRTKLNSVQLASIDGCVKAVTRRLAGAPRSPPLTDSRSVRLAAMATTDLRQDLARWRARHAKAGTRDVPFTTLSGEPIRALYTEADLPPDPDASIGLPGEYPFTRGVYPSMYRGRLWTMRQFAGFGTAEETNARFRYLLDHGQTGLSTAFDMPSLMGHDSDHARSLGEVG